VGKGGRESSTEIDLKLVASPYCEAPQRGCVERKTHGIRAGLCTYLRSGACSASRDRKGRGEVKRGEAGRDAE
jgi:hypothetical protein